MPMEQLQIATFQEAMFQSRNAEEGLLVALNVCARTIGRSSIIEQLEPTTFGTWLMRIEGQRRSIARGSLSFLTLPGVQLFSTDLFEASLVSSGLEGTFANFLCAAFGDLSNANFKNADLIQAHLAHSKLSNTNFERARLNRANMNGANLEGANLTGANLRDADLTGANLTGANLTDANLEGTNLKGVKVDERVAEQIRDFQAKQKALRQTSEIEVGGGQYRER